MTQECRSYYSRSWIIRRIWSASNACKNLVNMLQNVWWRLVRMCVRLTGSISRLLMLTLSHLGSQATERRKRGKRETSPRADDSRAEDIVFPAPWTSLTSSSTPRQSAVSSISTRPFQTTSDYGDSSISEDTRWRSDKNWGIGCHGWDLLGRVARSMAGRREGTRTSR